MATGLQVFDANGACVFDTSDRLSRFIGEYRNSPRGVSAPTAGSLTVQVSAGAKVWFYANLDPERIGNHQAHPAFSLSGNVISWNYLWGERNFCIPFVLTYGEY